MARGIEDLDAIASLGLGHVQRDVGAARDLVEQHVAGFVTREPQAQRHGDVLVVDAQALVAQCAAQTFRRLARLVQRAVREQHQEFLAAVTSEDLARVHRGAQRRGETLQQLVAHGVSEAIVDGLEVIEIDEADDQRAACLRAHASGIRPPCARWRGD